MSRALASVVSVAPPSRNALLDVLPCSDAAIVAATLETDSDCTALYAWRPTDAEKDAMPSGKTSSKVRKAAPRLAELRGGVSFRTAALVSADNGHALLTPQGDRHAGVVAEWSVRRERVVDEYTLAFTPARGAEAQPLHISSLHMRQPRRDSTYAVVGAARSALFVATLDSRAPHGPKVRLRRTVLSAVLTYGLQSRPVVVDMSDERSGHSYGKQYLDRAFTCIAMTNDKRIVAGDTDGRVHFYDRIGKKAALTMQMQRTVGSGDAAKTVSSAIRALDVTPCGRWVVVTLNDTVGVIGPFDTTELKWPAKADAPPVVVCTLSSEDAARACFRGDGKTRPEPFREARIIGSFNAWRYARATVHRAVVDFALDTPPKHADTDDDDDEEDANGPPAPTIAAWGADVRTCSKPFTHCRIVEAPGAIVAHRHVELSTSDDADSEIVALADCVGALAL